MARTDLLLKLVEAGTRGEQQLFRKVLEALIADERAKQHHILADRLAGHLNKPESLKMPSSRTHNNAQASDHFFEVTPTRRLGDLVLSDTIASACMELIEEQNRADILRYHNIEPRHRVLLAGPPGNGKTSLAEALATELSVPLLVVRYESVITSYLGETAVRLVKLFDQVRTRQCVLFFDEFDVVGKERGDANETGEIKRVVSSLLLQVDVLPSYVIVITATNHPELLDSAVWRRFQIRLDIPSPTHKQIEEWFCRFERRLGEELGVSFSILVKTLEGVSFSELEQLGQDIQRRYVLSTPHANLQQIVEERLNQHKVRSSPKNR